MGGDGFTLVHVTTDPVEGALLVDVLHGHSIEARLHQVNGALMGAGQQIFQTRVEVPAAQAAQARELIEELGHPGDLEEFSEPPEPATAEAGTADVSRQRRIGAGIALIVPGAGHFRARWPWTTGVLVTGILACLILVKVFDSNFAADAVFVTMFVVPLCDALGARKLVRGAAPSQVRQLTRGFALLGVASLVGTTVAAAAALPGWLQERMRNGIGAGCSATDFIVWNQSSGAREIGIERVAVAWGGFTYRVPTHGPARALLAPGQQLRLTLGVPPSIVDRCRAPSETPRQDCWLLAFVTSTDPTTPDAPPLEVRASCTPGWVDGTRVTADVFDPAELEPRFETFYDAYDAPN